MISAEDRAKAAFLAEYRTLCEKHGMLLLLIETTTRGAVFAVAEYSAEVMDQVRHEVLLEPMRLLQR